MKRLGLLGVILLVAASVFEAVRPAPVAPADAGLLDEPVPAEPVDETLAVAWHVTADDGGQRKGHRLATIEAPDFDPTSDVYQAQAEVVAAQHDVKRMKALFEVGEPRADLEVAIDRLRDARTKLAQARRRHLANVDGGDGASDNVGTDAR